MLDWAGFAVALTALSAASAFDLKSRLIPDSIWLLSYPPAAALLALRIIHGDLQPVHAATSVAVAAGLSAAFYFLGLIGAADLLAILLIGVSLPRYPQGLPVIPDPIGIPVFSALCNAAVSSIPIPAMTLAKNVARILSGRDPLSGVNVKGRLERIILLMTAVKVSVEDLKRGLIYFPAERVIDGKRVPMVFVRAEQDLDSIISEIEDNKELFADGVLASPTVPMILCLAAGLALTVLGNIVCCIALSYTAP
ncbi:MAG: prepilin peptidase [Nitrososphaerota archaeon]